jgi:hypothetical protein
VTPTIPDSPPSRADERSGEPQVESESPERVCPNCGRALAEFRCKLVCPDRECGYFLSCSDFY